MRLKEEIVREGEFWLPGDKKIRNWECFYY